MNLDEYSQFLNLVKTYHAHQTRNGGSVPYWVHCFRVSKILEYVLSEFKENPTEKNREIILAGLGHDLYEDTKVKREYIKKKFGQSVDLLISEVTNQFDDYNMNKNSEKLKTISEAGLLIKLADMIDNTTGATYGIHENGSTWTNDFLLPIIHNQWLVISEIKFNQYPKSAKYLKSITLFSLQCLKNTIKIYQQNKMNL
jgi:(p)ppGpp synthase/HD superfamily hydrolase